MLGDAGSVASLAGVAVSLDRIRVRIVAIEEVARRNKGSSRSIGSETASDG